MTRRYCWVCGIAGRFRLAYPLVRWHMHRVARSMPDDDYVLVDLPCGCQDVHYADGRIDREHDHVVCDGKPKEQT